MSSTRARSLLAALVLICTLAVPSLARATTLERMTVADLSRRASTVVVGTVVSTSAQMRFGEIVTAVQVKVTEPLKGGAIGVTTVYVPGGTLPGGLTQVIDGMPTFVPGETAAFFVDGLGWVMGGHQGKVGMARGLIKGTGQPASALTGAVRDALAMKRPASGFSSAFVDPAAVAPAAVVPAAVGGPTITSIGPGNVGAGIGATITITGSGFGDEKGSVSFYYQSGKPRIPATVVSTWTDTRIVCEVPVATVDGYSASAGSGPVIVTTAGGTASSGFNITIAFGNGQRKWAKNNAAYPTTRVTYRVNAGGVTGAEAMVDSGAAAWSAAGADFAFVDGGTFSSTPLKTYDGKNDVSWAAGLPTGVIAQAGSFYQGGYIVESNVTFSTAYSWGTGAGGTMDVQTIATHELGHWLFLRDMYGTGDTSKVMYGFCNVGTVKRTLTSGDIAGARWIYGNAPAAGDTAAPTTTSDAKPSYLGPATVRLTATDGAGGSGVAHTYYRTDSGPQAEGTTVTVATEGWHTLEFWSTDTSGNVETKKSVGFTITLPDTTAPVTTSDAQASYTDAATIHLSASDAGTGVASTRYELDGGQQAVGTSLTVAAVGEHVLRFWSVDAAGNAEAPNEARFTVTAYDLLPPDTFSDVATSYVGIATIPLLAGDDRSGVAATYYRVDGGAISMGTTVTVSVVGTHTIEYWSIDAAGNAEVPNTAIFTVRPLPKPTLGTPSAPSGVTHGKSFTVSGSVRPRVVAGSTAKLYFYRYESGAWKQRKTATVKLYDYSTYSKYSVKTSVPSKGKWRVRCRFAGIGFAVGYSSYRNITAK